MYDINDWGKIYEDILGDHNTKLLFKAKAVQEGTINDRYSHKSSYYNTVFVESQLSSSHALSNPS